MYLFQMFEAVKWFFQKPSILLVHVIARLMFQSNWLVRDSRSSMMQLLCILSNFGRRPILFRHSTVNIPVCNPRAIKQLEREVTSSCVRSFNLDLICVVNRTNIPLAVHLTIAVPNTIARLNLTTYLLLLGASLKFIIAFCGC